MSVLDILFAIAGVISGSGIVGFIVARRIGKIDQKLDDRENARIEESVIIMKGLRAVGHLAEATAISQRDGKTNGEMRMAMEYYTESKDEMNDFLTKQAAKQVHARC